MTQIQRKNASPVSLTTVSRPAALNAPWRARACTKTRSIAKPLVPIAPTDRTTTPSVPIRCARVWNSDRIAGIPAVRATEAQNHSTAMASHRPLCWVATRTAELALSLPSAGFNAAPNTRHMTPTTRADAESTTRSGRTRST